MPARAPTPDTPINLPRYSGPRPPPRAAQTPDKERYLAPRGSRQIHVFAGHAAALRSRRWLRSSGPACAPEVTPDLSLRPTCASRRFSYLPTLDFANQELAHLLGAGH
jgi:hypothetical protein